MTSSGEMLPRLLALVPYLVKHPGVSYAKAATDLSTTETQLRKDLELLSMCGVSKYYTDSLVEVEFDGDTITMYDPQGVRRPLRLTGDEATALVVALRALAETPGLADQEPVLRALAKVEAAVGAAGAPADRVAVELAAESHVDGVVRQALEGGRALRLTYWTASRDATSERVVDPVRLLTVSGRTYLEAWCRLREDLRTFHLGRVQQVEVLDEPSTPPVGLTVRDPGGGLFQPGPEDLVVRLVLRPAAAWVAEYYPVDEVQDTGDGSQLVTLRARDEAWVRRLVLSLGAGAEVVEPPALRAAVLEDARGALAAYEK
ncbi:MAG TPA: WYL domain-containing protein [Mycobacteriales bacterium]|nr:WYL domain-containing protein [Mycobacteriales bacterium]